MSNPKTLSEDVYLLDRDRLASARLMFQHHALTEMQGWQLYPGIRASIFDRADLRIADLATGNAMWAFGIAKEFPNAEVAGIDISDAQFPPRVTWPSNVTLEIGNLFEPTPGKYKHYFDIVHVRLIVTAIYKMDKDVLVQNILSMLKPGGYIQWDECVDPSGITVNQDLSMSHEAPRFVHRVYELLDFREALIWAETLPSVFRKHGLEQVVDHKPALKPSTLPQQTELLLWVCREIVGMAIKNGVPKAEEVLQLMQQEMDEFISSGYMLVYAWIIAVGRKPISNQTGGQDVS